MPNPFSNLLSSTLFLAAKHPKHSPKKMPSERFSSRMVRTQQNDHALAPTEAIAPFPLASPTQWCNTRRSRRIRCPGARCCTHSWSVSTKRRTTVNGTFAAHTDHATNEEWIELLCSRRHAGSLTVICIPGLAVFQDP